MKYIRSEYIKAVVREGFQNGTSKNANRYEGDDGTALIEAIFTHYQENSDLYVLLYKRELSHISLQSLKDVCGPRQEQNNKAAYTSEFISGGLYGWIEEWFKRGMQESPKEMATMLEAST